MSYAQERRQSHEERIIDLLRKARGGWVPCSVFTMFSKNHTARISGLRNKGFEIECREVCPVTGATEYRLIREDGVIGGQHQFICVCIDDNLEIEHVHVTAKDQEAALRLAGFVYRHGAKAIAVSKHYKPPVEEETCER